MERMPYEYKDHHHVLLEELKTLLDDRLLVDVYLCVGSSEIPCHRNVLSAASPYFRAMFTSDMSESKQMKVTLHEVDATAVALLVEFAYTGKVEVSRQNAQNLLATASLLEMLPIQRACAKFMEMQLDTHNCIGIREFAVAHNLQELASKAREFIEKNFVQVADTEEFLNLGVDQVVDLLGSDDLNVEKEEVVWEAALAWVNNNHEDRHYLMGKLLSQVRLSLLPSRFIQESISPHLAVQRSETCQAILSDMKDFERNPQSYTGDCDFSFSLRTGMIKPEHCILLLGGLTQSKSSINCYNPLTRETFQMAMFPDCEGRTGYYCVEDPAVVVAGDSQIYAAGGNYIYHECYADSAASDEDSFDDFDEEESVRRDLYLYDNDNNRWVGRSPMLFPKSNFTLVHIDGKIYSFGGLAMNQHPTEICESYDIEKNQWSYVGMMPINVVDLASVAYGGCAYLLGGRSGVTPHNHLLRYDPRAMQWTTLAHMDMPRFNFGACVVDDEIWVAGGQKYTHSSRTIHRESLRTVEVYNIANNSWRQGHPLPASMFNVGLVQISGAMYACGMVEHQRSPFKINRHNMVYRLDLVLSEWQKVEGDLCEVRSYAPVSAKLHTRKLSQVFRPEVDT